MGEAKRRAANRPTPAPPEPGDRAIEMDVAQIEYEAAKEKISTLMKAVARANIAAGAMPFHGMRAYARTNGDLRICVVMGVLHQVIIPATGWRELSPDDIIAQEQQRFASGEALDPSSLRIPYGHIGFMVMVPGFSPTACIISVNEFYKKLAEADRKLGEFSADTDPRKNTPIFAEFRKQAFETLAVGLKDRDQAAIGSAMQMLMWASMNVPGKGDELRKGLSTAIADHDRAGIVMKLIEHNDRVATSIGQSLALPDNLNELMHSHEMSGVADTIRNSGPTTRRTH